MKTTHPFKLACLAWLLLGAMAGPVAAADTAAQAASGVATQVGKAIEHGVSAAASGVARGMQAAASGVERGVKAAASAVSGVTHKVDLSPASAPAKAD